MLCLYDGIEVSGDRQIQLWCCIQCKSEPVLCESPYKTLTDLAQDHVNGQLNITRRAQPRQGFHSIKTCLNKFFHKNLKGRREWLSQGKRHKEHPKSASGGEILANQLGQARVW